MKARIPLFRRRQRVAVNDFAAGAMIKLEAELARAPVIATPNEVKLSDAQREVEIELARQRMLAAPHLSPQAHTECDLMTALIKDRSDAIVASMEQARGLAARS